MIVRAEIILNFLEEITIKRPVKKKAFLKRYFLKLKRKNQTKYWNNLKDEREQTWTMASIFRLEDLFCVYKIFKGIKLLSFF